MGRPWRRRGHLQRIWLKANRKVVVPAMRNEHGTDVRCLPIVYRRPAGPSATLLATAAAASGLKPTSINSHSRSSGLFASRVMRRPPFSLLSTILSPSSCTVG